MTTFVPSTWENAGLAIEEEAETMYVAAHDVIVATPLANRTRSPIEVAMQAGDAQCNEPWHVLIAGAKEAMTVLSSKMHATGTDYEATEEAAATQRFWEE